VPLGHHQPRRYSTHSAAFLGWGFPYSNCGGVAAVTLRRAVANIYVAYKLADRFAIYPRRIHHKRNGDSDEEKGSKRNASRP
jgi:hypothetical protein